MQFESPYFFWGLLTLLIPIAIHFFNRFRAKKLAYSDVSLLKQVAVKTNRINKLKQWLTLLSRLLLLFFLVLAFTQPFIGEEEQKSTEDRVVIFIDNSQSAEISFDGLNNLDRAKAVGNSIIGAHDDQQTKFLVCSIDYQSPEYLTAANAKQRISELSISSRAVGELAQMESLKLLESSAEASKVFWVSDFQRYGKPLEDSITDGWTLVALPNSDQANVIVDSIWMDSPIPVQGESLTLKVRFRNLGNQPIVGAKAMFVLNGREVSSSSLDVAANGTLESSYEILDPKGGENIGEVLLEGDAVRFDNRFCFAFQTLKSLDVHFIGSKETGELVSKVYSNENAFSVEVNTIGDVDYEKMNTANLLIVEQSESLSSGLLNAIKGQLAQGKLVLALNPSGIALRDWDEVFKKRAVRMSGSSESVLTNKGRDLLSGVFKKKHKDFDMPVFNVSYVIEGGEPLMSLNRKSILARQQVGNGNLYLAAFDLSAEQTNLTRHAIFVPLMYQLAFASRSYGNMYIKPGGGFSIPGLQAEGYYTLANERGESSVLELLKLSPPTVKIPLETKTGLYELQVQDSSVLSIAVNNVNRESKMVFSTIDELEAKMKTGGIVIDGADIQSISPEIIKEGRDGLALWKYCVILALIMLLVESLILRYIK